MIRKTGATAIVLGCVAMLATPAQACWTNAEQDAARIANMNQMLMVSALRCRFGEHNFLESYNRFVRTNNMVIASQHEVIKARYARVAGNKAAFGELDKFMIGLANHYGGGNGAPDCGRLELLSADLAKGRQDIATLAGIADREVGVPRQAANSCSVTIASRR